MCCEHPKAVEVVLSIHPADYERLCNAAQLMGLAIEDFCKLAIHQQIITREAELLQLEEEALAESEIVRDIHAAK